MSSLPTSATALVIVDHGSRRQAANQVADAIAAMIRDRGRFLAVAVAHMEIAEPTLAQALGACVDAGARRIVVTPLFLAPGRHASEDIPGLCADQGHTWPDVAIVVAAPLGADTALADLLLRRADEALATNSQGSGDDAGADNLHRP